MNTMVMEGAPSAWSLAMATLQANEVYTQPPAETGLLCRTCLEIVPLNQYAIRKSTNARASSECLTCEKARRAARKLIPRKKRAKSKADPSKPLTLKQICIARGTTYDTIRGRMLRGMTMEEAFAYVPRPNRWTGGSRGK